MLLVGRSPGKGRGIFAARDIEKGEIIEMSPVIVIPQAERSLIRRTILRRYVYRWGEDYRAFAIALGYGSLFNHSYSPNALYENMHEMRCMKFTALSDISAGEEVTVNYNRDPLDQSPIRFQPSE